MELTQLTKLQTLYATDSSRLVPRDCFALIVNCPSRILEMNYLNSTIPSFLGQMTTLTTLYSVSATIYTRVLRVFVGASTKIDSSAPSLTSFLIS